MGTILTSKVNNNFLTILEEKLGLTRDKLDSLDDLITQEIKLCHSNLKKKGYPSPEVNILDIWKKVLPLIDNKLEKTNNSIIELIAITYELFKNRVWPMPGAQNILKTLQKNYHLGIVSNAQFYTPIILETLFNSTLNNLGFQPEFTSWSYKHLRSKPDIEIFSSVLEVLKSKYSILSENVVYIGNDMLNDVWTASQVGCKTILFAGDKRSLRLREQDKRINNLIPHCTITDLNQLVDIL